MMKPILEYKNNLLINDHTNLTYNIILNKKSNIQINNNSTCKIYTDLSMYYTLTLMQWFHIYIFFNML